MRAGCSFPTAPAMAWTMPSSNRRPYSGLSSVPHVGAEAAHDGRRRMGVGGGNQDAAGVHAAKFCGAIADAIGQLARDHEGVRCGDHQAPLSVVEGDGARMQLALGDLRERKLPLISMAKAPWGSALLRATK